MAKDEKNNRVEELLEKLIIIELAKAGVNRDEIKEILNIGSNKVSSIYKFFSTKGEKKS